MRLAGNVARTGEKLCMQRFSGKNLKNRDHLQVIDTDGWDYVKMDLKRVGWEGVKWINLAQNRVQWRSV